MHGDLWLTSVWHAKMDNRHSEERQKFMRGMEAQKHDQFAPYWAGAFIFFRGLGISTVWIDLGAF